MNNLPEDFVRRLRDIVGDAALPSVLSSFNGQKVTTFRVNTLLSNRAAVLSNLQANSIVPAECNWLPGAFSVEHVLRKKLLESEPATSGHIYIQNLSSMIPVVELDPQPGENVLDLTAAPGSKTSQIAALMNNDGYLAAVESVRSRYFKMKANLERLGVTVVRPILKDGAAVSRHRPDYFDRVLLDAPCSSEGRFRTDDSETTRYWSLRKIREMRKKQLRLMKSAVGSLREGGILVYSTCSFAPEENESVVSWVLSKFPESLREQPLTLDCPNFTKPLAGWEGKEFQTVHSRRVLPDSMMDAFFVAKFRKLIPGS